MHEIAGLPKRWRVLIEKKKQERNGAGEKKRCEQMNNKTALL